MGLGGGVGDGELEASGGTAGWGHMMSFNFSGQNSQSQTEGGEASLSLALGVEGFEVLLPVVCGHQLTSILQSCWLSDIDWRRLIFIPTLSLWHTHTLSLFLSLSLSLSLQKYTHQHSSWWTGWHPQSAPVSACPFCCSAMDYSNHSIIQEAGLEAGVAHGVQKEKGLLIDPWAVVVKTSEGPASLLPVKRLLQKAACHHLIYDNQVQLFMGQVSHLTAHWLKVIDSDGGAGGSAILTKVALAVISCKLLDELSFSHIQLMLVWNWTPFFIAVVKQHCIVMKMNREMIILSQNDKRKIGEKNFVDFSAPSCKIIFSCKWSVFS